MASSKKTQITPDQVSRLLNDYSTIIEDHERLKTSIKSIMGFYHLTAEDLAKALAIPVTTLQYKLKQPDSWDNVLLAQAWEFFRTKSQGGTVKKPLRKSNSAKKL